MTDAVVAAAETCHNEEEEAETMAPFGDVAKGPGRLEIQRGADRRPRSMTAIQTVRPTQRDPGTTTTTVIRRDDRVLVAEAEDNTNTKSYYRILLSLICP
jgi:hypothetical protein